MLWVRLSCRHHTEPDAETKMDPQHYRIHQGTLNLFVLLQRLFFLTHDLFYRKGAEHDSADVDLRSIEMQKQTYRKNCFASFHTFAPWIPKLHNIWLNKLMKYP